jgi:gamma-glutamylcyclotransferase (GGCT)/AIG2-like uncharacterized protein YtfP
MENRGAAQSAQLPVFVYGTLRPGEANHCWLLAEVMAAAERAVLPGHQLYGTGMAFPYVTPATAPGRQVVGDLLTLDPDAYPEVLERLDALEGYRPERPEAHSHYLRQKVTVLVADQPRQAWVYLAGPGATDRLTDAQLSATGDWLAA